AAQIRLVPPPRLVAQVAARRGAPHQEEVLLIDLHGGDLGDRGSRQDQGASNARPHGERIVVGSELGTSYQRQHVRHERQPEEDRQRGDDERQRVHRAVGRLRRLVAEEQPRGTTDEAGDERSPGQPAAGPTGAPESPHRLVARHCPSHPMGTQALRLALRARPWCGGRYGGSVVPPRDLSNSNPGPFTRGTQPLDRLFYEPIRRLAACRLRRKAHFGEACDPGPRHRVEVREPIIKPCGPPWRWSRQGRHCAMGSSGSCAGGPARSSCSATTATSRRSAREDSPSTSSSPPPGYANCAKWTGPSSCPTTALGSFAPQSISCPIRRSPLKSRAPGTAPPSVLRSRPATRSSR